MITDPAGVMGKQGMESFKFVFSESTPFMYFVVDQKFEGLKLDGNPPFPTALPPFKCPGPWHIAQLP